MNSTINSEWRTKFKAKYLFYQGESFRWQLYLKSSLQLWGLAFGKRTWMPLAPLSERLIVDVTEFRLLKLTLIISVDITTSFKICFVECLNFCMDKQFKIISARHKVRRLTAEAQKTDDEFFINAHPTQKMLPTLLKKANISVRLFISQYVYIYVEGGTNNWERKHFINSLTSPVEDNSEPTRFPDEYVPNYRYSWYVPSI